MTMKKKAGRLDSADLMGAISAAADHAKARIEPLTDGAVDHVAGGAIFDLGTGSTSPSPIDVATDGMWPSGDGQSDDDTFGPSIAVTSVNL